MREHSHVCLRAERVAYTLRIGVVSARKSIEHRLHGQWNVVGTVRVGRRQIVVRFLPVRELVLLARAQVNTGHVDDWKLPVIVNHRYHTG